MKQVTLILTLIILAFFGLGFSCGSPPENECNIHSGDARPSYCREAVHVPFDGARNVNNFVVFTPGGVTVRSVVDVPMQAQLSIDQAAHKVITETRNVFPGWTSYNEPASLQVVLIDPDHYSVETDPGAGLLSVWYTALGGTEKAPNRLSVSSADTCYACPGFFYPDILKNAVSLMAVVPHQANVDPAHPDQSPWSHMRFFRESVYNSFEHVQECGNTTDVCLQFAIAGDAHPHWDGGLWNEPLPEVPPSLTGRQSGNKPLPCHGADCKPLRESK